MADIGEIIRLTISYSMPVGGVAQTVHLYEVQDSAESDSAIVAALDAWIGTNWVALWENIADSHAVLYLAEYDVINTDGTVDRNLGEELHADAGTLVGDMMPPAVAGFIQANTERTKSLGRKYIPAISETRATEGTLDPTALGILVNMLTNYVITVDVGATGHLVAGVLSRVISQFLEFDGTGYATDVPAYQRRRKPGVGS